MSEYITVIGGVNMDISAALTAPFVPADSVPGQVTLGCGGVARNIAHNLRLMGHEVKFVSAFGGETFGEMCWNECQAIGLDLSLSERCEGMRNGLYLCVNDQTGDMIAAVADTDIVSRITPQFLDARIDVINSSALVMADTNISTEALQYLIDHCTSPLMVDTVSTAKAPRIIKALQQSQSHRLHSFKLNCRSSGADHKDDSHDKAAKDLFCFPEVQHITNAIGHQNNESRNGSPHYKIVLIAACPEERNQEKGSACDKIHRFLSVAAEQKECPDSPLYEIEPEDRNKEFPERKTIRIYFKMKCCTGS